MKVYACEYCGGSTSPTANTIFHKSSTPLTIWFEAIFIMAATRAGISAKQLERETGVTYKTAWRMFHQIRSMMSDDGERLYGEIEIDETYMHADPLKRSTIRKPHKSRKDNPVVFGMAERGGVVRAKHVKSAGELVLLREVEENIQRESTIYSDEHRSYKRLYKKGYYHETIQHGKRHYVDGDTHTQNIENFWGNMKRGMRGVYRHVSSQHLQNYVNEYAFRQSHRNDFQPMFWALMDKVSISARSKT